jgi:hypothetical protein
MTPGVFYFHVFDIRYHPGNIVPIVNFKEETGLRDLF